MSRYSKVSADRLPAHRLTGDQRLAATWRERVADNLAAIELLGQIEAEDCPATADEQQILARFVGFGASELANPLFPRAGESFPPTWRDLGRRLEERTTPAERPTLARSTQYAHYTPDFLVRWLWAALQRLGFAGGRVLEPGCGIGLFLAQLPPTLAPATRFTGIEAEPISARMARLLFPSASIRNDDFTTIRLPGGIAPSVSVHAEGGNLGRVARLRQPCGERSGAPRAVGGGHRFQRLRWSCNTSPRACGEPDDQRQLATGRAAAEGR